MEEGDRCCAGTRQPARTSSAGAPPYLWPWTVPGLEVWRCCWSLSLAPVPQGRPWQLGPLHRPGGGSKESLTLTHSPSESVLRGQQTSPPKKPQTGFRRFSDRFLNRSRG
eukprot:9534273-Lingulodinium_polyedra.AAC.1